MTADETARRSEYSVVVIDVENNGGRVAWHAAGLVAKEQLDLHRPKPGDAIAVLYVGEETSKRGRNQYKRWLVAAEHNNRPIPRHRVGMENGPDDYPDNVPPESQPIQEMRALIISTLNTIADAETRHRAKRTYADRFTDPRSTPAKQLANALAWTQSAAAGTEILDPL